MFIHLQKKKNVSASNLQVRPYVVVHAFSPSTPEAEQEGSWKYEASLLYIVSRTSYIVRPNIFWKQLIFFSQRPKAHPNFVCSLFPTKTSRGPERQPTTAGLHLQSRLGRGDDGDGPPQLHKVRLDCEKSGFDTLRSLLSSAGRTLWANFGVGESN